MLRIRLTRTGKKHQPTYRIVVAENSAPIKGKFIEILGYYLPIQNPKVLEVNADRVNYWLSKGAQATDTVHNLLVTKGVLTNKRDIKYSKVKPQDEPASKEEPKAEVEPEPEASTDTAETTSNDEANISDDATPTEPENPESDK